MKKIYVIIIAAIVMITFSLAACYTNVIDETPVKNENKEKIVYKAFGMKEKIPEHCIPSENHWWAHYISD